MNSEVFWKLFIETGDIRFYLLYKEDVDIEDVEKSA
jgi:hypothetical protein